MITALRFEPVAGGTVTFNVASIPASGGLSVERFDTTFDMDGQDTPKHQQSGQFPNYMYVRRMVITQEGKIVGASASGYASNRSTLAGILPDSGTQADRNHGTLFATFTGQSEVQADVVITALTLPLTLDGTTTAGYSVTWRADNGYWVNAAGSTVKL